MEQQSLGGSASVDHMICLIFEAEGLETYYSEKNGSFKTLSQLIIMDLARRALTDTCKGIVGIMPANTTAFPPPMNKERNFSSKTDYLKNRILEL